MDASVVGASPLSPWLDEVVGFDPSRAFDGLVVPPRWAVYLLADADDRPVQLLCVRNLRYSLRRRLGEPDADEPASKRVDYRAVVRRVHWRRVDSAFEADLAYHDAARHLFPRTFQGMVGYRPAWFVHVNEAAAFPRYTKTTDLTIGTGTLLGPLEDKRAAGRLIELLEDAFDLCRFYSVLVEAPHGQPCAYKEMGKCPAPCDGSIGMEQYRRLIGWSRQVLADPAGYVREQDRRMRQAAGELRFEAAAKIKAYVEQLSQLGTGPFRHVRAAGEFQFVAVQAGPRSGSAKVFLASPGRVELVLCVADAAAVKPAEVLRAVLTTAGERAGEAADADRIGVVTHHLFARKPAGAVLPLATVDERAIGKAIRDVGKRATAEEVDDEGLVKELQDG